MIKENLLKMGLNPSPHDPCLLSGVVTNPSSTDTILDLQSQLCVGLYFKFFVFYSSDPTQEALFKTLLQKHIQVNFMGDVEYFLGTAFNWLKHDDGNISVHLCQSAFTEFTAHWLLVHTANKVPNMTPYCSGSPINSIPPVEDRSIRVLLAASNGWQLALAMILPLHLPFLPHSAMLPTHITTSRQYILSKK